ncbi:MAG: hypothetical protein AAGH48_06305, partial [Pseudomonadota bacterium]
MSETAIIKGQQASPHTPLARPIDILGDRRSPASCLPVMLAQLNWTGDMEAIAECLPYFSDDISLVDVRNALVALGYRTTARRMTLEAVDDRLRPCLFALEGDGRTGVLVGRTEAGPYAYI